MNRLGARLIPALTVLTLAQIALSVYFVLSTNRDHDTAVDLVAALVVGCSFAGTGLFAWWRRPANLVGPLMWLTGFFWLFNSWVLSDTQVFFVLGYLLSSVSFGLLIHLLLVFPEGELEGRLDRWIVAGAYLVVVVLQLASAFLIDPAKTGCDGCPDNPLLVTGNQNLYDILNAIQSALGIAILIGLVVALRRRWRSWPQARRLQFAPVLWAGGISLALIALMLAVEVAGVSETVRQAIFLAAVVPFAFIPFAFLAGLLRSRISRAEAVGDLVAGLSSRAAGPSLRDAVAEALSDDSVELAYWVPQTGSYVDADGVHVELPDEGDARLWAEVTHDGRPVGAIIHSGKLDDAADVVHTIASAAGLRMENERLDAELRARLEDLRASRARIVEAGYQERRRVERDLHDGAQQRLLALTLNLKLARSQIDVDPAGAGELLDQATADLEEATAELRELARGIHPGLLTDRGLRPALDALASRAPIPTELSTDVEDRQPAGVEAAAYFLVSEALANVAKHAHARQAAVNVSKNDGSLLVEVSDDGRGGADPSGSGLQGLADRVAALDGEFTVSERQSGGTIVRARIPLG